MSTVHKVSLSEIGGGFNSIIVFEVTPKLHETRQVQYDKIDPIHAPGSIMSHRNSPGATYGLSAKLVSRTQAEATLNLKYLNLLRSWTKNKFGVGEFGGITSVADGVPLTEDAKEQIAEADKASVLQDAAAKQEQLTKVDDAKKLDAAGTQTEKSYYDAKTGETKTEKVGGPYGNLVELKNNAKQGTTGFAEHVNAKYATLFDLPVPTANKITMKGIGPLASLASETVNGTIKTAVDSQIKKVTDPIEEKTSQLNAIKEKMEDPFGTRSYNENTTEVAGGSEAYSVVLGLPPAVLELTAYSDMTTRGNIYRVPVVITNMDFQYDDEVDYIPTLNGTPFPIVLDINITLETAHSPSQLKGFNLAKFRTGGLLHF